MTGRLTTVIAGLALSACATTHAARHGTGLTYDQLPDGAYAVVADVHAIPGREDELREATLGLVARVRAEPNNILYFLQEDREHPGHFVFYEIFASEADFNAHNVTPHVQAWFARLPELADGDVHVMRLRILGNETPPP